MSDQTQVSTDQNLMEEMSFPDLLQFGEVTLTNDFQHFIEAVEYAISSHIEYDQTNTTMSARELLAIFKQHLDDDTGEIPRYWRIGSLVGEVIAILYPTLNMNNPSETYLECLSRTFQKRDHRQYRAVLQHA